MAIDKKAYALANGYTDETVIGGGAIKGKNCTISKIEDIDGGHRITFGWTLDNGTTKSQTLDVKDGVDGHTPVKGVDYYDGEKGEPGIAGLDGKDGTTYTPSIGEVTTVESNVEASASVSVNTETKEAVFNFAIPKGDKGLDGVQISDNETVENKTWSSSKIASEIPTTLPANGGNSDTVNNHTVNSDVPENAVFTDTVYDDTEVKGSIEEINANLGELKKVIQYENTIQLVNTDYIRTDNEGFTPKLSRTGNIVTLSMRLWCKEVDIPTDAVVKVLNIPDGYKPIENIYSTAPTNNINKTLVISYTLIDSTTNSVIIRPYNENLSGMQLYFPIMTWITNDELPN